MKKKESRISTNETIQEGKSFKFQKNGPTSEN